MGFTAMTDTPVEEMSFEAAMAELEKVLGQLERGDVALDESISLYERGAKLKKRCETKLDGDGNPVGVAPVGGV
jgi:exodeoxyribonuclease VII small subunit